MAMTTFLMILLAVVIVIATLILGVFFWLRRKVRKYAKDFRVFLPFLIPYTARLALRVEPLPNRDEVDEAMALQLDTVTSLWDGLAAKGMRKLCELESESHLMVAGQHPASKLVALVVSMEGVPPFVEFIALSPNNTATLITTDSSARPLQLPSLTVRVEPGFVYDDAASALAGSAPGRDLDTRMLIILAERLHAARMDSVLARAPTLDDMRDYAARSGVAMNLSDAQQAEVLALNRSAWLEAVRESMLDNARRRLKLEDDTWRGIGDHVLVIHQAMNVDEIIDTMSEHPLVERLGEQLIKQGFGPMAIFDEINRRMAPERQHALMVSLGVPLQGRVYVRQRALEAAGIELGMVPA